MKRSKIVLIIFGALMGASLVLFGCFPGEDPAISVKAFAWGGAVVGGIIGGICGFMFDMGD